MMPRPGIAGPDVVGNEFERKSTAWRRLQAGLAWFRSSCAFLSLQVAAVAVAAESALAVAAVPVVAVPVVAVPVAAVPVVARVVAASSGGGTGGGGTSPPTADTSYVRLTSDVGDFVGGGHSYTYSKSNAALSVTTQGPQLSINVEGDQRWHAEFRMPSNYSSLSTGTYNGLARYLFHDAGIGGFEWTGDGRGCNQSSSSITITKVVYEGTSLAELQLQFIQYCDNSSGALRGDIYWNSRDATKPPGPMTVPSNLWRPAAGSTPAAGTFVYLESQPGDYIGMGRSYLYTPADASVSVFADGGGLAVGIDGDESWSGEFKAMMSLVQLQVGYYGNLLSFPFENPARGGLLWSGEGRGCNELSGWFVVDRVTYTGTTLTAIDIRFEQHCEGAAAALRGAIRYSAADSTTPAGPVQPPAGLWQPAAGATPASGNYVYLESQPGDYIGAGQTYLYTQADAVLTAVASSGLLTVGVAGDESWGGRFRTMNTLTRLASGYYGDLQRDYFHNPAKGGLDWSGAGRGCNTLIGWFVVDSVTYSGAALAAIDLRFEQHCEGVGPALKWQDSLGPRTTPPPPPVRSIQPRPCGDLRQG